MWMLNGEVNNEMLLIIRSEGEKIPEINWKGMQSAWSVRGEVG